MEATSEQEYEILCEPEEDPMKTVQTYQHTCTREFSDKVHRASFFQTRPLIHQKPSEFAKERPFELLTTSLSRQHQQTISFRVEVSKPTQILENSVTTLKELKTIRNEL